jgi:small conductance mechanosensitive channel
MDFQQATRTFTTLAIQAAGNVVAALALWFIGRWLIRICLRVISRMLNRQGVDRTLATYLERSLAVVLNIALVISVLGFFGVQTTTFAAIVAAGGVAIGVAWSGLLANLAAGAFLVVLRPFKVGDTITAAGVTGTVEGIGLFGTNINTADNVLTMVGNNKIMSETIQNYSANAYRRVDLTVTLHPSADYERALEVLQARLKELPFVNASPPPQVELLDLTPAGPTLCVRPYCTHEHYWDVYFETTRAIRDALRDAGIELARPTPLVAVEPAESAAPIGKLAPAHR